RLAHVPWCESSLFDSAELGRPFTVIGLLTLDEMLERHSVSDFWRSGESAKWRPLTCALLRGRVASTDHQLDRVTPNRIRRRDRRAGCRPLGHASTRPICRTDPSVPIRRLTPPGRNIG